MSLLSSIVLLFVGYILLRLTGLHHRRTGDGVEQHVVDVGLIAADLGIAAVEGVRAFVRILVGLWTFLRPYVGRLVDPALWSGTQDAVVNGVRSYIAAARTVNRTPRPSQAPRAATCVTGSDDFDWSKMTDIAESEFDRSMPPLVEAQLPNPGIGFAFAARHATSPGPSSESSANLSTAVPYLMGNRLAEASGSNTVLPSGINVCSSGKPPLHLAHTNTWYAVIVGREPGCYYSWHVAGPQVLNCPGQTYRSFRAEDAVVDYYTDQLMLGNVTKVIAPPFLG